MGDYHLQRETPKVSVGKSPVAFVFSTLRRGSEPHNQETRGTGDVDPASRVFCSLRRTDFVG